MEMISEAEIAQFRNGDLKSYNPGLATEDQAFLLPYDDEVEFPKDRLKLGMKVNRS